MNTIQEVYNDILMTKCENKTCFYYRHFIAPDAKTFIKQYFQDGQKGLDQDIIHYIDNNILDNMRIEHMKSAFLMGVYIYNKLVFFRNKINEKIEEYNIRLKEQDLNAKGAKEEDLSPEGKDFYDINPRKTFLYLWFLTCLYHDIGYIYEDLKKDIPVIRDYDEKYEVIKNKKYDDKYYSPKIMNTTNNVPDLFISSYQKYFEIKLTTKYFGDQNMDHAIAGGMRLYEAVYKKHYYYNDRIIKFIHMKDGNGLLWGAPIFDNLIVPCIDAIIAHNIWFPLNDEDDENYKKLELRSLIIPKNNGIRKSPITYKDYPLLFLLDFVDTIEPIKFWYKKLKNQTAWQEKFNIGNFNQVLENSLINIDNNLIFLKYQNLSHDMNSEYDDISERLTFLKSDLFIVKKEDDVVRKEDDVVRKEDDVVRKEDDGIKQERIELLLCK